MRGSKILIRSESPSLWIPSSVPVVLRGVLYERKESYQDRSRPIYPLLVAGGGLEALPAHVYKSYTVALCTHTVCLSP